MAPLAWCALAGLEAAAGGMAATAAAAHPLALPLRTAPPPGATGARPVIAVLALNEGTETTDFLVPHAVLRQAQVGVVEAVAPQPGPVVLMPALEVEGVRDFASFDAAYPAGADIVVVPAMHRDDDPARLHVAFGVEGLALAQRVEDAEIRLRVAAAGGHPLPAAVVGCEIKVIEVAREVGLAPAPVQAQVLDQKTPGHHA